MADEDTPYVSVPAAPAPSETSFFDPSDVRKSVESAVSTWMASLRNTAVSRNTGAWNAVQDKLPSLVDLIVTEITK